MTDRKAIIPTKPMSLPIAIAHADWLLRLWEIDLEIASTAEIRTLCQAGAVAMRDGVIAGVVAALNVRASRVDIVREIDDLIAAFPGMRKDADLGVFSKVMAEEIDALAPPSAALKAAMRGLIRTSTFPPGIEAVVGAVTAQKGEWASRAALLERLPRRITEAVEALGSARGGE